MCEQKNSQPRRAERALEYLDSSLDPGRLKPERSIVGPPKEKLPLIE